MKLEISLFKFDKDSDYLPYYTKHFLKIKEEKNLLDILKTLSLDAPLGYLNSFDFDLVLNGIFVKNSISIEDIISNFGSELTIEPISIRRAYNDLLCNEDDFNEKLKILENFVNMKDEAIYQSYKEYFYSSNTLNYQKEYIGDAILLLASNIIAKNPELEEEILNRLKKEEIGAAYHTSLKDRIFNFNIEVENKIVNLQKKLQIYKNLEDINFKNKKSKSIDFGTFEDSYEIKYHFENFNILYFSSQNDKKIDDLLNSLNANFLELKSAKFDIARNTFEKNKSITLDVVADIMLDAFDNSADFILVDNDIDFYLFDSYRDDLLKISGRDVNIGVVHINELQKLVNADINSVKDSFSKHCVNPDIL